MRKFDYTAEEANTVNSIVYIISAVASPIFGLVIDKTGKNVMWVFLSVVVTIGAHSMLAFTFLNPYVGMVSIERFKKNIFMMTMLMLTSDHHGIGVFDAS